MVAGSETPQRIDPFLMSVLAIGAIVVRVRQSMPKLNPLIPWVVQLSAVCFCTNR